MKNVLILIIATALGYFFWPSKDTTVPTEVEEEIVNEIEEIPDKPKAISKAKPKPKPVKPVVKLKAQPIITKQKKINMPLKAAAKAPNISHYKSKTPPKEIEFKINKDGFAIAFGDVFLGKVNNPQNLKFAKTEPKPVKLWDSPDIPYVIDKTVNRKDVILSALAHFNENTNLNFYPNDGNSLDGIVFTKGDEHCYSYLGKTGGFQPIYLSNSCEEREIAHEIMHTLGFIHEHTRLNRDEYVTINWDNIQEDFYRQFALAPAEFTESTLAGFPFSYTTIMLYDPKSFAIDKNKNTIESTTSTKILRSRNILSPDDIRRINTVY